MLPECCNRDLHSEKHLLCTICKRKFHYKCLNIEPETVKSEEWKCQLCYGPKGKSDTTPIRVDPKITDTFITQRKKKRPAPSLSPDNFQQSHLTKEDVRDVVRAIIREEMAECMDKLRLSMNEAISDKLKCIQTDIQDVKNSMDFMNAQYEEIFKNHTVISERVAYLEEENKSLQSSVKELRNQINMLEQQSRACNVEIQGVVESKSENLIALVKKLGDIIGCPSEDKIRNCTRTAKINRLSTRPRSIVVQFSTQTIRDNFLASAIKYNRSKPNNKLNNGHIGMSNIKDPIFVVEHLSPANKALHAAARLKAKEMGYKYVWVRNGRIFLRKTEGAEQVFIKSTETLSSLR